MQFSLFWRPLLKACIFIKAWFGAYQLLMSCVHGAAVKTVLAGITFPKLKSIPYFALLKIERGGTHHDVLFHMEPKVGHIKRALEKAGFTDNAEYCGVNLDEDFLSEKMTMECAVKLFKEDYFTDVEVGTLSIADFKTVKSLNPSMTDITDVEYTETFNASTTDTNDTDDGDGKPGAVADFYKAKTLNAPTTEISDAEYPATFDASTTETNDADDGKPAAL